MLHTRGWIRTIPFLVTFLASIAAPSAAEACGCAGHATSPASVKHAAAVFVGTAETVSGGMPRPVVATFTVTRAYRGAEGQQRVVVSGDGTTCDIDFRPGTTYVVYAYRSDRGYTTHKCTRTRPLSWAAEDIRYLDALAAGEPRAVLHGEVLRRITDRTGKPALQALFETLEVVAQRGGRRRSVATDTWGPYQLVLTAGEYNVWAERQGRRVTPPIKVVLRAEEERYLQLAADFVCDRCVI